MPPTGPEQASQRRHERGEAREKPVCWLKRLLVLAGAVLVLAGLAHAPFVRDRVRQYAVAAARDRFDTALSIGALDYNLLTLTFHATDVTAAATRCAASRSSARTRRWSRLRPGNAPRPRGLLVDRPRPAKARVDPRRRRPLPPSPLAQQRRTDAGGRDRPAVDRRPRSANRRGVTTTTVEARDVSARLEPAGGHIAGRLRRERHALPHAGRRRGRHRPDGAVGLCPGRPPDRPLTS